MAPEKRRARVLLAKMGLLDPHDTGVKLVTHMLRDAGMEVIYAGLYNTVEDIVTTSLEEDVDVIGISFHAASYLRHTADLMQMLREKGSGALVLCGGIIKPKDVAKLKNLGVAEVFLPGAAAGDIVGFINSHLS